MTSAPRSDRASRILHARRLRVRRMRRAIAVLTVTLLIGLFAVVYGQMAAGRDPALGTSVVKAQVRSAGGSEGPSATDSEGASATNSPSPSPSDASDSVEGSEDDSPSSNASGSSSASQAAPPSSAAGTSSASTSSGSNSAAVTTQPS